MEINLKQAFCRLANDVDLDPLTIGYCSRRLKIEGYKFLTVTLPKLAKAVLKSLELGYFDRPTDFAWKRRSLRYFRSFLDGIFDPSTGKVLECPNPHSLRGLRQLCEYAYKLALPFTEKQLEQAEADYVKVEAEVSCCEIDEAFADLMRRQFETNYPAIAHAQVSDVLTKARPRYGPGAFSASQEIRVRRRLHFNEVKVAHDGMFGTCTGKMRAHSGFFKPYPSSPTSITFKDEVDFCEVLFVPKDSRGPRVISKEPMHLLRLQMSFFDWLSSELERASGKRINFQDQQINRCLAELSSRDKLFSTLDLKEASDRVSYRLARKVFSQSPAIRWFINHARTKVAKLPSGRTIQLSKLAGMGSGLTFATMSLLISLAVAAQVSVSLPHLSYGEIRASIFVYGDDLVVPSGWVGYARAALGKIGLLLNESKCFVKSNFRESCGGDYFNGLDVAPIRVKFANAGAVADGCILKLRNDDVSLLEVERHARECVKGGLDSLADYYYSLLERRVGPLPAVSVESPYLGRVTYTEYGTDGTGMYEQVNALLPVSRSLSTRIHCPYKFLATKISEVAGHVLDYLKGSACGSAFGEVALPREVRLVKREVSAFALMG